MCHCTIMRAWQDIVQGTPSTEEGRYGLSVQSVPEKGPLEILLARICHEPLTGALQLGRLRLLCYSSHYNQRRNITSLYLK